MHHQVDGVLANIRDGGVVVGFDEIFLHGLVRVAAPNIEVLDGISLLTSVEGAVLSASAPPPPATTRQRRYRAENS